MKTWRPAPSDRVRAASTFRDLRGTMRIEAASLAKRCGETMHVLVTVAGGEDVTVALRNEGQLTRPLSCRRGDGVVIAWRPEDCQVLEDD